MTLPVQASAPRRAATRAASAEAAPATSAGSAKKGLTSIARRPPLSVLCQVATARPSYRSSMRPLDVAGHPPVGPGVERPPGTAEDLRRHAAEMAHQLERRQPPGAVELLGCQAQAPEPVLTEETSRWVPKNARVESFLPRGPILEVACCVVCHAGNGDRANGPGGRTSRCARCPSAAINPRSRAGSRWPALGLACPPRDSMFRGCARAVLAAMEMRGGAERVTRAFKRAGGAAAAADVAQGAEARRGDLQFRGVMKGRCERQAR